jgi:hypothetical protein
MSCVLYECTVRAASNPPRVSRILKLWIRFNFEWATRAW